MRHADALFKDMIDAATAVQANGAHAATAVEQPQALRTKTHTQKKPLLRAPIVTFVASYDYNVVSDAIH